MTNPASTASPSKDNAVRLRENQRRSRQRKKEYLVSLEARFRECQRTGIEASIEIQNAAKRVVRENGRLRELLRRKGVSEAEIDAFVNAEGEEEGRSAVETVVKRLGKIPCGGAAGGETCSKRKTPSQRSPARSASACCTPQPATNPSPCSAASEADFPQVPEYLPSPPSSVCSYPSSKGCQGSVSPFPPRARPAPTQTTCQPASVAPRFIQPTGPPPQQQYLDIDLSPSYSYADQNYVPQTYGDNGAYIPPQKPYPGYEISQEPQFPSITPCSVAQALVESFHGSTTTATAVGRQLCPQGVRTILRGPNGETQECYVQTGLLLDAITASHDEMS